MMADVSRIRAALSSHRHAHAPTRTERGATLVEYAMIVAVFAVPAWAGISFLQSTAEAKMGHVATNVASPPTTTPAGSGGDGGGGATSTTASTTTTTAAPTTTTSTTTTTTQPPTTTTTRPPTTTTTSTTTTTTAPRKVNTSPSISVTNNKKKWNSTFSTTATDGSNKGISGATVTFEYCFKTSANGSWGSCKTVTATTNSSGVASYSLTDIADSNVGIRVTVKSITKSDTNYTVDSTPVTKDAP